ncbi:LapA family protein [Aestuariispira insulae]|uniref:Uncharacterized protein DUF1049 n=1 Tax=Aestuariispira insulae TaxID=1461337 RepID=A0A3D9H9F7_9PROT|nr:LapA family protein [Aestuariispira insulae]RED46118.1 uncharacterized protein DUF1049 [Aestuariispira insulae]
MRLINWLVALPVTLLAISFAASNLERVEFKLWPLPMTFDPHLPLFTFCVLLIGFLLGAVTTWVGASRTRSRARQAERKSQQQAREINDLERKVNENKPDQALLKPQQDKTVLPPQ